MITKDGGSRWIECDSEGCTTLDELGTDTEPFDDAVREARRLGYAITKQGNEYKHSCSDCNRLAMEQAGLRF